MINDMADESQSTELEQQETSVFKRWSERKAKIQAEQQLEPVETVSPVVEKESSAEPEAETPAELTDEDMPPIESLDEKSDVSMFFSPKVSAHLKQMALNKIFHLPMYNIRDGLNEYDEDYTKFEPLGDTITSDMRHMQEVAERKRKEKEEAEALAAKEQEQEQELELAEADSEELIDSEVDKEQKDIEDINDVDDDGDLEDDIA